MDTGIILLLLGVFYFFAQGLTLFFQRTRIPDVLILVVVGIILGPITNMVAPEDFGKAGSIATVIALTVILFESGISLKLSTMATGLLSTLSLTFITSFITIGVIAAATVLFFDGNWGMALLTGSILSGTSAAVVIPMVQSLKLSEKPGTILILESALTDVICIILAFALWDSLETGQLEAYSIANTVFSSLIFAIIIGIAGGLFWLFIWDKIRKLPASVFTTVAFAFVIYGFSEFLHVSGAIATLAFGITLANLPGLITRKQFPIVSENEKSFYCEVVFLLKTFFFVYLGVSVKLSNIGIIAVSFVVVLILYFLRIWITRFTLTRNGSNIRDAVITSVMIPKGLAPAVLSSLIVQKGLPGAEIIQSIVFAVVIFSIFLTAVLVPLVDGGILSNTYGFALKPFSKDES